MKPVGFVVLATFSLGGLSLRAADATSPVDYTDRNTAFAPGNTVSPQKQAPALHPSIPEKRIEKSTIEKSVAPLADRRAPFDVKEAREKQVRTKDSKRPEKLEQPTSGYNHQPAGISTGADAKKPPTVAKYQDSMAAASATKMANFPAMDRATTAKINRFAFQKNPPETSPVAGASPVTPAAGGSPLRK